MESADATKTTFACTHQGGLSPLPPQDHDPSTPWPPLTLTDQFCYDCSADKACEWIKAKEARHVSRISLLKQGIQCAERILSQEPRSPTLFHQHVNEQMREIEQRNQC